MNQRQILNTILIVSLAIVICNNILFNEYPAIIPKGSEIGNIFSNLSLAYIASYIFYLVVVVYKENKDRKNIYSTVHNLARQLVSRGNSVVTTLASANKCLTADLTQKITKEDFFDLCKKTNPKDISPNTYLGSAGNLIPATYSQLIYNNSYENSKALINNIFIYMPFLESDFIKLLNKLNDSEFYIMAPASLPDPFIYSNNDFENIADSMYKFHLILREIENYIEKEYKKYID